MGRFYFQREDGGIYSHTDDVESLKEFVIGGSSKKDQNCKLSIERLAFVCASGDLINTTNSTDLPVMVSHANSRLRQQQR